MWDQLFRDFVMLFVTVDPIGTLALFVPLTGSLDARARRAVAVKATLVAAAVLLAFLVGGELLLAALGIHLTSFQLAGSVVLFLFGLQMVFGTGVAASHSPEPGHDIAVFPLALPSIANPGSIMAVVLLTDNHRRSILEQAGTAVTLLVVLGITLATLLLATPIHRRLGVTGSSVAIRVLGLILAALATEQMVTAIKVLLAPGGG